MTESRAPDAGRPSGELRDVDATWTALDDQGHLWYWTGKRDDDGALADRDPQRLVGPGASDRLATSDSLLFGGDHTIWQFDAADSGSVTVTTVTDRMGTALRIPRQGSATVLFLGRSVAVLG